MKATREETAAAFTEWERRWREEPDRFQGDQDRLERTSEDYGEKASAYFCEILGEIQAANK